MGEESKLVDEESKLVGEESKLAVGAAISALPDD